MKILKGKVLSHQEYREYILGKHYNSDIVKKKKIERIKKQPKKKKVIYAKYIKSDKWKKKREHIMNLYGGRCFDCTGIATQVHHLTYKNLGDEKDEDLIPLCGTCHQGRHELLAHQL